MNSSKVDLGKPPYKRANILLRLLGPGLVTGAADDDPSGIATYSQAGAQFGYGLLWTVFLTTPFMIAIQLVSAQLSGRPRWLRSPPNQRNAGCPKAKHHECRPGV